MDNDIFDDNELDLMEEIAELSSIIRDQEEYITDLESQVTLLEMKLFELQGGQVL